MARLRLAILSNRIQLFFGVNEVGVDFESGFEFILCFGKPSSVGEEFPKFVVRHIVVRTDGESVAVESNRLFTVAADLGFLEVFAERAIAVPRFLILKLLPRQKIVDFLSLPGDVYFLSSKLFRLFFQNFRIAAGEQARDKKQQERSRGSRTRRCIGPAPGETSHGFPF